MSWHDDKAFAGTFGVPDPTTGAPAQTGPGLDAPNLEALGWMPPNRIFAGLSGDITLAPLEAPSGSGYLMAKIPVGVFVYTLEYRRRSGMDQGLPDKIVLIHQIPGDGLFYFMDSDFVGGTPLYVNPELTAGSRFHSNNWGFDIDVISTGETAVVHIATPAPPPPPHGGGGAKGCELAGGSWTCGEPFAGKRSAAVSSRA
jgi:hypothetical protein